MFKISKQSLNIVDVTLEEYLQWTIENSFPPYKKETAKEFFDRISDGRIVRDADTNQLINKRPRKGN